MWARPWVQKLPLRRRAAWGKCGAKMIQYMALGVPVVVSPIGSGAEILAAGEVGLPARTLREWSESLCTILENPELARRLGAEGRRLVERLYSVETNAPRLARIFADVLATPSSGENARRPPRPE